MGESEPKKFGCQFFTTDEWLSGWVPIDNFFYAPYVLTHQGTSLDANTGRLDKIVHLEGHASLQHAKGWCVEVTQGEGDSAVTETFDDYPSALRRMADIIEAFEKGR